MVILRLRKVTLTTLKQLKFPTNQQDSYLVSPNGHFETQKVTLTTLKRWKFPTNHQDSYLRSPKGHFETYKSYTNHI